MSELVDRLHELLLPRYPPDLTLLLDLDPDVGLAGVGWRAPPAVSSARAWISMLRVRDGFRRLAAGEPGRFAMVDAEPRLAEVGGVGLGGSARASGGIGLMPIPTPATDPTLLGHADAEQRWQRALTSGRLPHGWLVSGPRGVGKATLAYRMARRLLAMPGRNRAQRTSRPVPFSAWWPAAVTRI